MNIEQRTLNVEHRSKTSQFEIPYSIFVNQFKIHFPTFVRHQ